MNYAQRIPSIQGLSVLALAMAFASPSLFAQRPTDVLGIAQIGLHVSDVEKSIKFYEALDFKVTQAPAAWKVDKGLNKLLNTPGAESRTAILRVQSSVSDVPFHLVLRQFRGVQRQDWSKAKTWDPLESHMDLTVEGSVSPLLDKLEALGMLKMPEINGLQNPRQQAGFRPYAFIQDPDGFVLEYFGKRPAQPGAPPLISNSKAGQNMDRWGKQAGFNHYATNVLTPEKAQDFYVKVLGGDYPEIEPITRPQLMMHGWFPQATTDQNVRVELIYFTENKGKAAPPKKLQDINVSYAVFQVSNIETAYKRAKDHGAVTVTDGGIMTYEKDRVVMIRDSDVGGYILLWQPAR